MKISMSLTCQLFSKEADALTMLTKEQTNGLSIGGFFLTINGQEVPFDWDDFNGSENNGVFSFETGRGWFKDYELSDCYDSDYQTLGLNKESISAEFLASATQINEIHMNFIDANGDECDFGTNTSDEDFRIRILALAFTDVEALQTYAIAQDIIDEFNNRN